MRSLFLLATLLLPACAATKLGIEGASCKVSADCEGSLQCLNGACRTPAELGPGGAAEPSPAEPSPAEPASAEPASAEPASAELKASLAETQREVESLRRELLQLKEGSGELTAVECRAFAEKVVELTVQGQTGAAADMARSMIDAMRPEMEKECREKGTRPEIECALRVNSLDELERCDASKTGGKVKAGGVGKPTERSCQAFADKVVELTVLGQEGEAANMARSMIEAMRPEMVKECQEKGSASEIACALKAESLEDLERCDGR